MIYSRTLVQTLIILNQADNDKKRITFEPLVQIEKFKMLNWSAFNFLLIDVIFNTDTIGEKKFFCNMNRCLATVHCAYLLDAYARGKVNF